MHLADATEKAKTLLSQQSVKPSEVSDVVAPKPLGFPKEEMVRYLDHDNHSTREKFRELADDPIMIPRFFIIFIIGFCFVLFCFFILFYFVSFPHHIFVLMDSLRYQLTLAEERQLALDRLQVPTSSVTYFTLFFYLNTIIFRKFATTNSFLSVIFSKTLTGSSQLTK